jgi:hypothetical protein
LLFSLLREGRGMRFKRSLWKLSRISLREAIVSYLRKERKPPQDLDGHTGVKEVLMSLESRKQRRGE